MPVEDGSLNALCGLFELFGLGRRAAPSALFCVRYWASR